MNRISDLLNLLNCHSTPGDEDEVGKYLCSKWQEADLLVKCHGNYAVSSRLKEEKPRGGPRVLICAHMDSPGYIVEQISKKELKLIKLGSPYFPQDHVGGSLKTRMGKFPIEIEKREVNEIGEHFYTKYVKDVEHGDRVCFLSEPVLEENRIITSPFLDNRIGCFILCQLAQDPIFMQMEHVDIILGATACEEVGCIGANVLAKAIEPNIVLCLDATYENRPQNIFLGKGPVLTLSDASVLLSCKTRDYIKDLFRKEKIPLQTEVYNYSGTDAKAFPQVGLACPVLALLVATTGNHSPQESAAISDIRNSIDAIKMIVRNLDPRLLFPGHLIK